MGGRDIGNATFSRRAVLGAATLATLAPTTVAPWPARADPAPRIKVGWLPGTEGRLYAAQAFRLFEKAGVDVELIRFNSGPAMNAAFQSGSIDIGYSGVPGFLVALAAGVPMRLFLDENEADEAEGLVARTDRGISTVKDLKGRTVGTHIGTTAWMGLVTALAANAVPEHDLKIVNIPLGAVVPTFRRGDVDAIWTWAPWLFDLEESGGKLVTTDSAWLATGNAWYGRSAYLDANRPAVLRFLAALDAGTEKIGSDRAGVAAFMSKQMGTTQAVAMRLLDKTGFPSFKEQLDPAFKLTMNNPQGGMAALVARYADVMTQHGLLRSRPDLTGAVDPSFLKDYLQGSKG